MNVLTRVICTRPPQPALGAHLPGRGGRAPGLAAGGMLVGVAALTGRVVDLSAARLARVAAAAPPVDDLDRDVAGGQPQLGVPRQRHLPVADRVPDRHRPESVPAGAGARPASGSRPPWARATVVRGAGERLYGSPAPDGPPLDPGAPIPTRLRAARSASPGGGREERGGGAPKGVRARLGQDGVRDRAGRATQRHQAGAEPRWRRPRRWARSWTRRRRATGSSPGPGAYLLLGSSPVRGCPAARPPRQRLDHASAVTGVTGPRARGTGSATARSAAERARPPGRPAPARAPLTGARPGSPADEECARLGWRGSASLRRRDPARVEPQAGRRIVTLARGAELAPVAGLLAGSRDGVSNT